MGHGIPDAAGMLSNPQSLGGEAAGAEPLGMGSRAPASALDAVAKSQQSLNAKQLRGLESCPVCAPPDYKAPACKRLPGGSTAFPRHGSASGGAAGGGEGGGGGMKTSRLRKEGVRPICPVGLSLAEGSLYRCSPASCAGSSQRGEQAAPCAVSEDHVHTGKQHWLGCGRVCVPHTARCCE